MEDTFTSQELSCYALFDERCPQTSQEIIESIRGENHSLPLYAYETVTDIPNLDGLMEALDKYYISLSRVCKKPYSHLKTAREVLRIDKVKKIGYEAIPYLASHPEDWQEKNVSGLKPARLLCITNEIDYGIYENKITKKLIDDIVALLSVQKKELGNKKEQMRELEGDAYANKAIFGWDRAFNDALWDIFLQGTAREDNKKKDEKVEYYLQYITDFLTKYRHLRASLLYRMAGDTKNISRKMHKTNLFCFDKNYNAVLKLWEHVKRFNRTKNIKENVGKVRKDAENLSKNYRRFCFASALYALSKMGFEKQNQGEKWCRGDDISVEITEQAERVVVTFHDTAPYRIPIPNRLVFLPNHCVFKKQNGYLVWPVDISQDQITSLVRANRRDNPNLSGKIKAAMDQKRGKKEIHLIPYPHKIGDNDEYAAVQELISKKQSENDYFVFPLSEKGEKTLTQYRSKGRNNLSCFPVSLLDVNSYRRLQKIFLGALIELCPSSDYCPLCAKKLGPEYNNTRKCTNHECGLYVTRTCCASCGQEYVYLHYDINEKYTQSDNIQWLQQDSQFRYVDIVTLEIKYNLDGRPGGISPVCPYCEKESGTQ